MLTNIDIFNYSRDFPEPVFSESYEKDIVNFLSENYGDKKSLQKAKELWELISLYTSSPKKSILEEIDTLIVKNSELNNSEFISYWSVLDVSFSHYKNIKNQSERIGVLEKLLDKYIQNRFWEYQNVGFSPIVIQSGKDAKSHKSSWQLWMRKVSKILDDNWFSSSNSQSVDIFLNNWDYKYITADQSWKKLFNEIIKKERIHFKWRWDKDNKYPDFLIRIWEHLYIVEHKHTKEGWWWQDKQINELISFIKYPEMKDTIHYVSFMDWVYFNNWAINTELKEWKKLDQLRNIESNLMVNRNNYFVNTEGFKKLISEFKK